MTDDQAIRDPYVANLVASMTPEQRCRFFLGRADSLRRISAAVNSRATDLSALAAKANDGALDPNAPADFPMSNKEAQAQAAQEWQQNPTTISGRQVQSLCRGRRDEYISYRSGVLMSEIGRRTPIASRTVPTVGIDPHAAPDVPLAEFDAEQQARAEWSSNVMTNDGRPVHTRFANFKREVDYVTFRMKPLMGQVTGRP